MFKKYAAIVGVLLIGSTFSFSHIYTPLATQQSIHHSSSEQHPKGIDCKTSCQGVLKDKKNKLSHIDQNDDKFPDFAWPSGITLATIGVGILNPDTLLQQSSWKPPDIILLSGQYSTSL
ncbi:MAG TPA: hypothetical protein VK497_01095 [Candidatus Saccharimonadales bacterium]|nr:hypothetical protein [Candidatus Saccharimonadales bacterium]